MEKTLRLKNYEFNYYAKGDPANLTLLFLHGFLGDHRDFQEAISLLANDFHCLAVDLPGHGKTKVLGGEAAYRMENTAQALIEFLDDLGITQSVLVGYSMGGRLALYLVLHFPQYFSKAILESASPGLKTQEEQNRRRQNDLHLAKELETEELSSFLSRWYNQPLFLSLKNHPNFPTVLARRLQNSSAELSKSLRNLGTGVQPSLWGKLKDNQTPLFLLGGDLDQKFVHLNTEISSLCKFSQLETIQGCGHNIHFENGSLFAEKVKNFLTTHETQ